MKEAIQNSCLHNKTHNMKSLDSPIFKVHVMINLETLAWTVIGNNLQGMKWCLQLYIHVRILLDNK